jgi:hypothetical protein
MRLAETPLMEKKYTAILCSLLVHVFKRKAGVLR